MLVVIKMTECGCGKTGFGKRKRTHKSGSFATAMKLHHSKGISLKAAWKMVKSGKSGSKRRGSKRRGSKRRSRRESKSKRRGSKRRGSKRRGSKRRGSKRSSKKGSALFRKAMKLHHSKKISLKKAWQIVKGKKKK
jgi:hypothetical protein